MTPFHVQKNLASFPFWNFACSKGLRRRSTKAGIFRKECNKSCQLIQSGKGVCVLNSISGGEETFSSPPSTLLWKSRYFFGTSKETFKIDGVCMMGLQIWKVGKEGDESDEHLSLVFYCHFHLSCFWCFCLFEPWN